jgi:nicotinamide-nucleotide amidase
VPAGQPKRAEPAATAVVAALTAAGQTLSVAESLTGGLLGAVVTAVPGASAVFRAGITAYATEIKTAVLGVDAALLVQAGAVDARVAAGMAQGARRLTGSDWALSTTGVAGPTPQDGKPVGMVFIGCTGPYGSVVRELVLTGDRESIRSRTVAAALDLLAELIATGEQSRSGVDCRNPGHGGSVVTGAQRGADERRGGTR